MERWLSWSKAHDWKSCEGLYPSESSNLSLSAKQKGLKGLYDIKIMQSLLHTYPI